MSNNAKSKSKSKKTKKKFTPFKSLGRFIAMSLMVCIVTGCIVATFLTYYIVDTMENEEPISLEDVKYNYTTIIYAPDDSLGEGQYSEVTRLFSSENRIWVDYEDMSPHLVNAAIAIEDKRFTEHTGVDWFRTVAAGIDQFIPIVPGTFGGSTLTQQLVKNVTGDNEVRVDRKVREIFRALALEQSYSKVQIMEAYLNTIALGNNTNGVEAAANLYFGKSASEVTPAEAAAIISITQNPSKWNPFVFPENNEERREIVLFEMHSQGYLTDEEYAEALAQELVFLEQENIQRIETVQNWFVDHVMEEVINDLAEKYNYTYDYAEAQLLSGGYRIYTTMDTEMQAYLDEAYTNMDNFPAIYNEEYPESAFVIMEPDGKIVALAGSNREKTAARLYNRATQALRQPGSTIKPIAAYTPAIENNLITWSTVIEDSPITLDNNGVDISWPINYYGTYLGPMTITEALQRSTNTLPVKLISTLTPEYSYDFLKNKLGMESLIEHHEENGQVFNDKNLSGMALGGLTKGVTPLELAGAYQIFVNGGTFTEPYAYSHVEDSDGNIILETNTTPIRVISTETSTVMNRLLNGVTTGPYGTGRTANLTNMPTIGKTGTSSDDYDQWFVGATPYYIGVTWLGYDQPSRINYAAYPPPIIWKNIMAPIHEDLEYQDFEISVNATQAIYCTVTGNLATVVCDTTSTGWYKKSNLPPLCNGDHTIYDEESEDAQDAEDTEESPSEEEGSEDSSDNE